MNDMSFQPAPPQQWIYFLLDEEQRVLYVGRTKNVRSRIAQHRKDKMFDSYQEFPVPFEHVNDIEAALINLFKTPRNYTIEASGHEGDLHYLSMFFELHFTSMLSRRFDPNIVWDIPK